MGRINGNRIMNEKYNVDYEINPCGGVRVVFSLDYFSVGEDESLDSQGECTALEFSYLIVFNAHSSYEDAKDVCEFMLNLTEEGLQELMEAEYKKQNQPEPDC